VESKGQSKKLSFVYRAAWMEDFFFNAAASVRHSTNCRASGSRTRHHMASSRRSSRSSSKRRSSSTTSNVCSCSTSQWRLLLLLVAPLCTFVSILFFMTLVAPDHTNMGALAVAPTAVIAAGSISESGMPVAQAVEQVSFRPEIAAKRQGALDANGPHGPEATFRPQRQRYPTVSVFEDAAACMKPLNARPPIDVSLVTQASGERLWMLPHICTRWGGTVVVATLRTHDGTRVQWPDMGNASVANGGDTHVRDGCSIIRLELARRDTGGEADGYPINWLRNMAIDCVPTSHFFIVDVDFWPSVDLRTLIRQQIVGWTAGSLPKALVIPSFQRSGHGCRNSDDASACRAGFERSASIQMPANFTALENCIAVNDCVVFDGEYNPQGQASTDVKSWRQLAPGHTTRVRCITSDRYEPFIVLRRSASTPRFDERFTGYGKNKVQLIVHLRQAGFAFEVLGHGFVVHFPHQRSDAKRHWLHSSAHGRVDRLFALFGREMAVR
jgi:hypothetical protein